MTYDPAEFRLVDVTPPPDMPRPVVSPYRLQAEPARKWKNVVDKNVVWLTSGYGAVGSQPNRNRQRAVFQNSLNQT